MLSYPTHFLKIAGSYIGDNSLEHSLKQANIFARRIVSQTFFATNKAIRLFDRHIHIVLLKRFQILVKCIGKWQKVTFLKVFHVSIHQHFSEYKDVCCAGNEGNVYQPKERLASNREIGKS